MINILTEPLLNSISVCGREYEIDTDFRTWIKIEEILKDSSISSPDKIIRIFSLAFLSPSLPPSIDDALSSLFNFLFPFRTAAKEDSKSRKSGSPLFSFSSDGGLIYAAFLSQYGIDLTKDTLHWWRFLSLFYALSASSKFMEVVKIRGTDLSSVSDPNQKSFIRKLKRLYRLDERSVDLSSEIGKIF